MIVSATVTKLKKRRYAFTLIRLARPVLQQVKQSEGLVHARTYSLNFKNGYTLMAWKEEAHSASFMRGGAHLEAMKRASGLAESVSSVRWESDNVPTKKEARRTLTPHD